MSNKLTVREKLLCNLLAPYVGPWRPVSQKHRDEPTARLSQIFSDITEGSNDYAKQIQDSQLVRDLKNLERDVDAQMAKTRYMPDAKPRMIWKAFFKSIKSMKNYSLEPLFMKALLNHDLKQLPQIAKEYDQMLKDHATLALWSRIDISNKPDLTKPSDIREWMEKNAQAFQNISKLDLNNLNLKVFPEELKYFTSLTELSLNDNQIKEIPSKIEGLSNLKLLSLNGNQIKVIPSKIEGLSNLGTLYLNDNQIKEVPSKIEGLSGLTSLYLNNNQIKEVPSKIEGLSNLTLLFLVGNQIKEFPSKIEGLSSLKWLYLVGNQIKVIPSKIEGLSNLTLLFLVGNQIKEFPSKIEGLSSLKWLYLVGNQIKEVPSKIEGLSSLTELSLVGNQIKEFPSKIEGLSSLERLYLNDNPLIVIPVNDFTNHIIRADKEKSIYKNELAHKPASPFARLYGSIVRQSSHDEQRKAFDALSQENKNLIYGAVYSTALQLDMPVDTRDSIWGEHHFFDDKELFARAVRNAILAKFERLAQEKKDQTYGKVWELAGRPFDDNPKWGEENALLCLQRLADAMELI